MKNIFAILYFDLHNIFVSPYHIKHTKKIKLQIVYFIFAFIVFFLINILLPIFLNNFLKLSLPKFVDIRNVNFFKLVVFTPVIEEFCFRAILIKNKINNILFLTGFSGIILNFILIDNIYIFISTLLIFVFTFLFFIKTNNRFYKKYKQRELFLIVYLSSFLFGFAHLTNFNLSLGISFIVMVYLLIKSFNGFIFSLLRLKIGLIYSILFHIFLNLIAYTLIKTS